MIVTKLIAATVAGAAFGAGALALAPSDAADGGNQAKNDHAKTDRAKHPRAAAIAKRRNVIHAEWTTRNKVKHQAIRGTVKVVSSKSITMRASDGRVETFRVTSGTKVRVLGDDHRGLDEISDVKVGYRGVVVGKDARLAMHVVAREPKQTS